MGTYYQPGTRENLIRELTKDESHINPAGIPVHVKCLMFSLRGNRLWKQMEVTVGDKMDRYIHLDLLFSAKGQVGYKPLSEDMGPYYWDCPKKFLKNLTAPMGEYSKTWRERVLARYKKPLTIVKT